MKSSDLLKKYRQEQDYERTIPLKEEEKKYLVNGSCCLKVNGRFQDGVLYVDSVEDMPQPKYDNGVQLVRDTVTPRPG